MARTQQILTGIVVPVCAIAIALAMVWAGRKTLHEYIRTGEQPDKYYKKLWRISTVILAAEVAALTLITGSLEYMAMVVMFSAIATVIVIAYKHFS